MNIADLKDVKVCRLKNIADRNPFTINLSDALSSFKGKKYSQEIGNLRTILGRGDRDEYSVQKSHLPSIIFCGQFRGGHGVSNLVLYNQLLIIDIDDLDKAEFNRVWNCLQNDKYVLSFWRSPSGEGIKGLIKLDYDVEFPLEKASSYHKNAFNCLMKYFINEYNINLDVSGSDISRLCFVSFDPSLVIKNSFLPFIVDCKSVAFDNSVHTYGSFKVIKKSDLSDSVNLKFHNRHLNGRGKNNRDDRDVVEAIIRYLTKKKKSITKSYDDWYRVAFAISNLFTCDVGEKYFLQLSKLDGSLYDEKASKKLLIGCYDNSKGTIGLGTLIKKAKQKGFILRGGSKDA